MSYSSDYDHGQNNTYERTESNSLNSEQKKLLMQYDKLDNYILKLQNDIKPMQTKIKDLKKDRKALKEELCIFMSEKITRMDSQQLVCPLPDVSYREGSSLKFTKIESVRPMSKDTLKNSILKFFREEFDDEFIRMSPIDKTNYFHDYVTDVDNRPKSLKVSLRRLKKRS